MQDRDLFYRPLREALSRDLSSLLSIPTESSQIDCYCQGFAVCTAIAKKHNGDAERWAALINSARGDFSTLFGIPYLEGATAASGMLFFTLTRGYYTRAIAAACEQFPPAKPLPDAVPDDLRGGFGRMYILARHAGTDCPAHIPMQLALFRTLGIAERLEAEPRLLRLRLREANTALLTMTCGMPLLERQRLYQACGAYGDAASRLLYAGLTRLYQNDVNP